MIICKNCGAELPDVAKFCTKCGYAVIPEEELRAPEEAQPAYDDWNAQAEAAAAYDPYPVAPQPQEPQYQQPQYQQPQYQQPPQYYGQQPYQETYNNNYGSAPRAEDSSKSDEGRTAMILAIIGAVLSELGLPGIILCAIAKGKVKAWEEKYGPATGMAKAAKIISTIGLVFSIIMTVFWIIYFVAIIGFVGAAKSGALEDFLEELFDIY